MKNSPMPPRDKPLGRNVELQRHTPLRGGPPSSNRGPLGSKKSAAQRGRDKDRKEREFRRKFHSLERVFFVQVVLGCRIKPGTRAENAHIERDGMGRKADYTKIVGLSKPYHTGALGLDTIGRPQFEKLHGVDLGILAARTEQLWQERGPEVIAQAKADGTYDAWLAEGREP